MKDRLTLWLPLLAGVVLLPLGTLWFLQGSDLVHIDPVACVGDCEPVTGRHPGWQVTGAATMLLGGAMGAVAARSIARRRARGSAGTA